MLTLATATVRAEGELYAVLELTADGSLACTVHRGPQLFDRPFYYVAGLSPELEAFVEQMLTALATQHEDGYMRLLELCQLMLGDRAPEIDWEPDETAF
jgi:hypothetical protein